MPLDSWSRKTLKVVVQALPYAYSAHGIELKGEAFFVEHELEQLRRMRLHDAQSQDSTAEHWLAHFGCKKTHAQFKKLAEKSRQEAAKYEALMAHVLQHGIPKNIRTSWEPRLPDWPPSIMWG